MSHQQIRAHEEKMIEKLLKANKSQKEIADILERSTSTISREIRRNLDKNKNYVAKVARQKKKKRRRKSNQKFKILKTGSTIRQYVVRKLKTYWSPEQIANKLIIRFNKSIICHETIYQFVYNDRPDLIKFLRHRKNKYRKRHGTIAREMAREEAKKRINQRPEIVKKRERIGDWEGDTIRGGDKKSAVLTHVDRKSGYLIANRLDRAIASSVRAVTLEIFNKLPKNKLQTITYDNGSEFAEHEITEKHLKKAIYFAYPYHSWERGTNENTNGLLRQFFPKGTDFTKITDYDLQNAVNLINNRPRKRLNYLSPKEIFSKKNCISN